MIIAILDNIAEQAETLNLEVKYVALSPYLMKLLVGETTSFAGLEFEVETLSRYKDIKLAVKDILGFQVSYDIKDL